MTVIVGLVDNGVVYMGGDSAGVAGLSISVRADEKVFINSQFLLGFTSSFRMGQILRYEFVPPQQVIDQDDMQFMVVSFVGAVRGCFSKHGFGSMADKSSNVGGTFLVGYRGNLYMIGNDFQVGKCHTNYDAVGCGKDLALGSLYSTTKLKARDRVKIALEAANQFSAGVSPPYIILRSK